MLKLQVLASCRHLLTPIVRWLLRSGVTWSEFAELSKEVYVDVARRDYGIQGRPTNNSRVAMITGLSRREVTRVRDVLLGEATPLEPVSSRVAQVLSGWHLDPEFRDATGAPAVLPQRGESGSIEALLKRYAGDLPHGAFVKELEQLGLIERGVGDAYRVLARDYVRAASDPDIVRQYGVALHDHAATLTHNVAAERIEPPRYEGMATTPRLEPRYVRAFAEFAAKRSQALLEEIDAWLVRHEIKRGAGDAAEADLNEAPNDEAGGGIRAGLGVYLIQDVTRRGRRK